MDKQIIHADGVEIITDDDGNLVLSPSTTPVREWNKKSVIQCSVWDTEENKEIKYDSVTLKEYFKMPIDGKHHVEFYAHLSKMMVLLADAIEELDKKNN